MNVTCSSCGEQFSTNRRAKFCSDTCRQRGHRSSEAAPASPSLETPTGPVERQVRADLEALVTTHPMGESLAEMSYNLARTLDAGAGLAVAAVNRELRANLLELAGMGVGDGDLDADLSTPSGGADVPPEVRDTKDT